MDKRLIFPKNLDDRRDVYFVREDRQYLRKHASSYHPKIAQYIENVKPMPDLVQILLTALGAYEYWGQNVNGDRFRTPSLSHDGEDYGHKTFATYANYFTHHVNKDPALAKGKVLHSVWNDNGKRVELIVGINPSLDPEGAAAVDRGDDVTFSMGCKVPFDVCTVCGNRAKTRTDYCDHLRYLMNQIDPVSNVLVGADNTLPKFFDISRVLIPADKTAHMWTKVASASNPYRLLGSAQLAEMPSGKLNDTAYLMGKVAEQREFYVSKLANSKKSAEVQKSGAITKRIELKTSPEFTDKLERSVPISKALLQSTAPALKRELIERIKHDYPLKSILSTLAALAMEPKPEEAEQLTAGTKLEDLENMKLGPEHFSPELASALGPIVPERSFARPALVRRIVILAKKLEDGDPETVKKAESIRDIMRPEKRESSPHPAYLAGLLAALYAIFGPHATGLAKGIGKVVADYPYIVLPLGAGMLAGMKTLQAPTQSGFYNVDDSIDGLYNKSWQSRFAQMQARPVTVIKTGADNTDTDLVKKFFYGIPAIYIGSPLIKHSSSVEQPHSISQFISENPDILTAGLLEEQFAGRSVGQRVGEAIESGKRIIKQSSIRNLEFLEAVPETEQELVWDVAILDAADRITKKVLGG